MSAPIIHDVEQRSAEWMALRCGMLTASTIGQLIKANPPGADAYFCPECDAVPNFPCTSRQKGKEGVELKESHRGRKKAAEDGAATAEPVLTVATPDEARPWLATLAAERITRHVEQTPTTLDMWRGVESEPFARDAYSRTYAPVREVGFITRDLGGVAVGYSPDGLVGDDGLIEIKAPRAKGHLLDVIDGATPARHMAQLQTGLLVTGRSWIDYISFAGGMALWRQRVYPLIAWQNALEHAARTAETAIRELTERYQAATRGLPVMERIPDYDEIEVA